MKWKSGMVSITPYAREMLDTNEKEARKLQVIHGRGEWHETVDKYGKKFLVSVVDVTCDFSMWQISGLPCAWVDSTVAYAARCLHQLFNFILRKCYWVESTGFGPDQLLCLALDLRLGLGLDSFWVAFGLKPFELALRLASISWIG
ncbi:hypothetical protein LWI28_009264 [Acer negundo]|uniref:Uncharacterized protein n=1 Tax=Acer negundo TaxID=4023 RepID=A0AAD5J3Z5_ACENE|nr:hypothetical protein LWI28_009264 [Acer negundo]